jgi:hypothetical protein
MQLAFALAPRGKSMPVEPDTALEASSKAVPSPDEPEVVTSILRALAGLEFGTVEIIVQNSKVVQIERTQRSRFVQPLEIPRT